MILFFTLVKTILVFPYVGLSINVPSENSISPLIGVLSMEIKRVYPSFPT